MLGRSVTLSYSVTHMFPSILLRHRGLPSVLAFGILAVAGCSSGQSTSVIKAMIADGLTTQFNVDWIPEGPITIMSGLSSQMEGQAPDAKRYNQSTYRYFQRFQSAGLLTLDEQRQSALESIGRMGAITVVSTPTEKLRSMADKDQNKPGFVVVKTGKCDILSIVRDTVHTSPDLPSSEEYRLVLGTYRRTPSPIAFALDPAAKPLDFRFKALLRLDPFAKAYGYVQADFGSIDSETWLTRNIK